MIGYELTHPLTWSVEDISHSCPHQLANSAYFSNSDAKFLSTDDHDRLEGES